MTIDDNDVLALFRAQATDDAPALSLQAEDVVRAGRRRQFRLRASGAGAVVVAAAAIAVAAVSVGGTDQNSERLPVDRPQTVEPVPEYIAHAMPAILKDAALTPLDKLPNWTEFRIDAYASLSEVKPLPERRWDEASAWGLVGASDDGALSLSVFSTGKPSQDPPSRWCAIERANGASECTVNSLPDGRLVYQLWEPPHADAESFGLTDRDDPGAGKQWYVRGVMVLEPRTGFTVTVRQGTPATSVDDATGLLWLAPEELVAMATNPILDLDGALPLPAAGVD